MKQFNTIEININDSEICIYDLHEFFFNDEVYYDFDDIIGWSSINPKKIKQYYNKSENFRNFLEEIKQDVSWIDKIIIWKYKKV